MLSNHIINRGIFLQDFKISYDFQNIYIWLEKMSFVMFITIIIIWPGVYDVV